MMSVLNDYERETTPQGGPSHPLPPRAYSDSEVFDLEMERIFRRDWIGVCGADELSSPGDYYAVSVAGEPIVVIRGADHLLRCFANVCRHRGSLLYDAGRGNASSIQCPYHAWTYDNVGRLTGVPHPGNAVIDKASHGLGSIRLEIWQDIVFINLDPEAKPLAPRLAGLERYIDGFQFDRFESGPPMPEESWKANWKLVMENGMDWVHLFKVHGETLDPVASTRNAFNIEGSPAWSVTASRLEQPVPERLDDPATLGAFERENYLVLSVPPNITFFANADAWTWLGVLPQSADQTIVIGGGRVSKHDDGPAAIEMSKNDLIMEEDRILCERLQTAMGSRRGGRGQLVELDRPIKDFHHYLGWRLFDHELAESWQAKIEPGNAPTGAQREGSR